MLPKDPRLRMTAANGSEIQNLGVKMIKFRGVEPDFKRQVWTDATTKLRTMTLKDQRGTRVMGEDEFEVDADGELGERKTKMMQDPKMPTTTEIEEHTLTHLLFRSWCRHRVRVRGKELRHKRVWEQGELPELHGPVLLG